MNSVTISAKGTRNAEQYRALANFVALLQSSRLELGA